MVGIRKVDLAASDEERINVALRDTGLEDFNQFIELVVIQMAFSAVVWHFTNDLVLYDGVDAGWESGANHVPLPPAVSKIYNWYMDGYAADPSAATFNSTPESFSLTRTDDNSNPLRHTFTLTASPVNSNWNGFQLTLDGDASFSGTDENVKTATLDAGHNTVTVYLGAADTPYTLTGGNFNLDIWYGRETDSDSAGVPSTVTQDHLIAVRNKGAKLVVTGDAEVVAWNTKAVVPYTPTDSEPTSPTTPINGVPVNHTINNNGKVILTPTDEQIRKLLDTIGADGVLNIPVSGIPNMKSAMIEIDLTKLIANDKLQIFTFSVLGMEISFPVGALESMRKLATILRFGIAPGSVIFELTDADGKEINWYDYQNPVTVSMPFTALQDISTDQIVMVREDGSIIPRSWYADGSVYAKVCEPGTYDAAIKPLGSFTDTEGLWMAEAVGYMGARGIVEGVGGDLFDAQGTITRAHFVTMLMRALDVELDYEEAMPPEDFESVPDWAQKSVRMATALGITLRDEDGNFNPNAPILRQEMFFMAYEAMGACGMLPEVFTEQWVVFDDWDGNVKGEYVTAIQNLAKLKLVNGNGDGTLNPNVESTRSEGAQFLYNILKYDAK